MRNTLKRGQKSMTKTKTEQFGRPDINQVMQAFTDYIGLEPTPKAGQRRYCKFIIDRLGDKTDDVVRYAISIQDDQYAPRISSPKDVYYKLDKIMSYAKLNNGKGRVLSL